MTIPAFVPDAARLVADLADCPEAYGTDWAMPGSGLLSPQRLVEIASRHLGRPLWIRAVGRPILRVFAVLHPDLRKIRPMIPHYSRPVRYDTGKLRGLLGELPTTPLEEGIPATLDWIVANREGS